jgi:hypothetical protein
VKCAVTPRGSLEGREIISADPRAQSFAVGDSPARTAGYRKSARPRCAALLLASADKSVYKVIELIGTSSESWEKGCRQRGRASRNVSP